MIVRDTICMQHAIVCHMMCIASEINNNAHSPRTCWRPRCLARGLCHMNTTCLPVKSTRQHVRSTHPVRQPPEKRHRSPCTLQHDSRVVALLSRAWRVAACRHDDTQSRGQQQAYCKDIMAYNGILHDAGTRSAAAHTHPAACGVLSSRSRFFFFRPW